MYMCVVASVTVGMGRSKDNVLESILSIYHVGTRNQTQAIRFCGEHLHPRSYLNQPLACFLVYLSPWLPGKVLTLSVPLSTYRASSLHLPAWLLLTMHQLLEGHLTVILLAFPLPCINQASLKRIHTLYRHQSAWTRAHAEDDPQTSVALERQCKNSYLPGPGSQFDM